MKENWNFPQSAPRVSQREIHTCIQTITLLIFLNTKLHHEAITIISPLFYFEGYFPPSGLIISLQLNYSAGRVCICSLISKTTYKGTRPCVYMCIWSVLVLSFNPYPINLETHTRNNNGIPPKRMENTVALIIVLHQETWR